MLLEDGNANLLQLWMNIFDSIIIIGNNSQVRNNCFLNKHGKYKVVMKVLVHKNEKSDTL